jgi:hypothetical protein
VADTQHTIHLVRPVPQKPPNPAEIAAEVLAVVRDCEQFLTEFRYHQERLADELGAKINELELSALRHMTRKARRS